MSRDDEVAVGYDDRLRLVCGARMSAPTDHLTLGLAPALTVEETLQFGPLTISPVREVADDALAEVVARFAQERGAHPECQASVTCPGDLRPLVPTIWSLFVFACVSFARRREHSPRGVTFPENFHLLSVTSSTHGLFFDSGHTTGVGKAEHLPLRWPVDWPSTLREGWWDRRIELACTLLARCPDRFAENPVVVASGMAADLACAAMERRNQKVQNVATGARTYVLLGSAFEALHSKGSAEMHSHAEVAKGVSRLDGASTTLGEPVFSGRSLDGRPPVPKPGEKITRPVFATSHLFHLRNTYAHGRVTAEGDCKLSAELNEAHAMHAATLVLAVLIGDDMSRELDCVVPGDIPGMIEVEERLGLPSDLAHQALIDGRSLLECLEEAIVPASDRSRSGG